MKTLTSASISLSLALISLLPSTVHADIKTDLAAAGSALYADLSASLSASSQIAKLVPTDPQATPNIEASNAQSYVAFALKAAADMKTIATLWNSLELPADAAAAQKLLGDIDLDDTVSYYQSSMQALLILSPDRGLQYAYDITAAFDPSMKNADSDALLKKTRDTYSKGLAALEAQLSAESKEQVKTAAADLEASLAQYLSFIQKLAKSQNGNGAK